MSDWADGFSDGGSGGVDWGSADWGSLAGAAGGLYNMFSGAPTSIRGAQQNAASTADPFGGLRGMAQGQLGQAISDFKNTPDSIGLGQAMDTARPYAQLQGLNPELGYLATGYDPGLAAKVNSSAGTARLNPFLQMMGTEDPSMMFRYQQGLDALGRGAAATGTLASGKQLTELEQYGQGFASQEFGAMFGRQSALQQLSNQTQEQDFKQNLEAVGSDRATRQQQFGNLATYSNLELNREMGQFAQEMEGANFEQGALSGGLSKQAMLLQTLSGLSTAGAGNASEAGRILAGKYQGSMQQSQSDIGGGGGGFLDSLGGVASIASMFF